MGNYMQIGIDLYLGPSVNVDDFVNHHAIPMPEFSSSIAKLACGIVQNELIGGLPSHVRGHQPLLFNKKSRKVHP